MSVKEGASVATAIIVLAGLAVAVLNPGGTRALFDSSFYGFARVIAVASSAGQRGL